MKNRCPICHSSEFRSVFDCVDHFVSRESFEIIECNQCGMHITKDFPPEDAIGKYYEAQDYISHSDTKKGLINTIYHQVRRRMLKKKALWVEKSSNIKNGHLLDMGAGTGYFADTMKRRCWQVEIVEQNEEARKFASKHFGLSAFATLEAYTKKQETNKSQLLDAITLWHVLEHLEHVNDSMKRFYELLKPDGILVIAVPNCSSYDARVYKNNWAAYDVPRHLWHFTPKQMRMLAKNNGFELVETKKMPFDAFYISMMSERYAGHKLSVLKGAWSGLCGFILSVFNKNNSSSIVYVLKK